MSLFQSIAVLPGSGEGAADEVWCIVRRYINGSWINTIERFVDRQFDPDTLYDAWFVDCANGGYAWYQPAGSTPAVIGDYPTLFPTDDQADLGLPHTTAISTLEELENMANDLNGNYYLTGDIDATETSEGTYNAGLGWLPIGTGSYFTGTLDGCGYTVDGLFINRPNTQRQGLFSTIDAISGKNPSVANLNLTNVDITGANYTGALAGYVYSSATASADIIIQNCTSSGSVKFGTTASNRSWLGGLVGVSQGGGGDYDVLYYDCSSSCTVNASACTGTVSYVGGLLGQNNIEVFTWNCFATGNVTGGTKSTAVGGFIGGSAGGIWFDYCYATGDVSGTTRVGGFVGWAVNSLDTFRKCMARGDVTGVGTGSAGIGGFVGSMAGLYIDDCYAWGDVSSLVSGATVGGFVGSITGSEVGGNEFDQCYCIGAVSAPNGTVGGFCADNQVGAGISAGDVYWDTQTSGTEDSDLGTGQTTTWLKTNPNYPATWDFDTIWYQVYTPATSWEEIFGTEPGSPLEGETVNILADGVKYPQQTVVGGTIDTSGFTNPDTTNLIWGLPVRCYLKPMSIGLTSLAFIPHRNITHCLLNLFQSLDFEYGRETGTYDVIPYSYTNYNSGPTLFTGVKRLPFEGNYTQSGDVELFTDGNLPFTIRALAVYYGLEDMGEQLISTARTVGSLGGGRPRESGPEIPFGKSRKIELGSTAPIAETYTVTEPTMRDYRKSPEPPPPREPRDRNGRPTRRT